MNILAIGAHPDDIELGCRGTLEKYKAEGNEITCFTYSRGRDDPIDQGLDTIPILTITREIECFLDAVNPEIVFTHSKNDLNRDHRIIHEATMVACRPLVSSVKEIYCYEVPSLHSDFTFKPQLYVLILIRGKIKIITERYQGELRDMPHPRSIDGIYLMGAHRGSQVGLEYAEAFEVMRIIK